MQEKRKKGQQVSASSDDESDDASKQARQGPNKLDPKNPLHMVEFKAHCKTVYESLVHKGVVSDGLTVTQQPMGASASFVLKTMKHATANGLNFAASDVSAWLTKYCKHRASLAKPRTMKKKNKDGKVVPYLRKANTAIKEGMQSM